MNEQKRTFPNPVDWEEMFPGRFLKGADLRGKRPTLTVSRVVLDELEGDKGKQVKGIVHFEKTDKQLALNKTNGICLKSMFGRNPQDWVGKRITLHAEDWTDPKTREKQLVVRVYGSPDIAADMDVAIVLPRKRPYTVTLRKVDGKPIASEAA